MKCLRILLLLLISYLTSINCWSRADPHTYLIHPDHIDWPSKSTRNIYIRSHRYNASNIIPTRFQCYGLSAVLAFPRLKPGVPITLGKISMLRNRCVPTIKPFPTWDMQEEGHANAIQNAVDLYLDEKKILWVLDSGSTENQLLNVPATTGPRVLGIDFRTGKILHEIPLRPFATRDSKFQYVIAENGLARPFVYIACGHTCSLVVFDVKKKKGNVITLPKPSGAESILYMVPLRPRGSEPHLVFSHLSYPQLIGVPVSALRRGGLGEMKHLGDKTGEMVVLGTDNGSKMFFRWKGDHRIRMWDLRASDWINSTLSVVHQQHNFPASNQWSMQTKLKRMTEWSDTPTVDDLWGNGGNVESGFERNPDHNKHFYDKSVIVGDEDPLRTSTHIAVGSRNLVWSLESNFPDFIRGHTGSVGVSAKLKPLFDIKR